MLKEVETSDYIYISSSAKRAQEGKLTKLLTPCRTSM
jgi:hypothetical protein